MVVGDALKAYCFAEVVERCKSGGGTVWKKAGETFKLWLGWQVLDKEPAKFSGSVAQMNFLVRHIDGKFTQGA